MFGGEDSRYNEALAKKDERVLRYVSLTVTPGPYPTAKVRFLAGAVETPSGSALSSSSRPSSSESPLASWLTLACRECARRAVSRGGADRGGTWEGVTWFEV